MPGFHMALEIQTQVLTFTWQALYWWSRLSNILEESLTYFYSLPFHAPSTPRKFSLPQLYSFLSFLYIKKFQIKIGNKRESHVYLPGLVFIPRSPSNTAFHEVTCNLSLHLLPYTTLFFKLTELVIALRHHCWSVIYMSSLRLQTFFLRFILL